MGLGAGAGALTGGVYGLGIGAAEALEIGSIVSAVAIGDAVATGAMAGAMIGGAGGAVLGVVLGGAYFYLH